MDQKTDTFASVAREMNLAPKTVRIIFKKHIEELERKKRSNPLAAIGIDEAYLGGTARCLIVDHDTSRVVDLLETQRQETVEKCLRERDGRERIRIVTMDMHRPYFNAVRAALPWAVVVVDRFHVEQTARRALERVRKRLRSDYTPALRRQRMRDRFLLLESPKKLNADELKRRDHWLADVPELKIAYDLKEGFAEVWTAHSRVEAERLYSLWLMSVPIEYAKVFGEVITAMANWRDEIFAYFDYRLTNGFAERAVRSIKEMYRAGNGYNFETIRAKAIYGESALPTSAGEREKRTSLRISRLAKRKKSTLNTSHEPLQSHLFNNTTSLITVTFDEQQPRVTCTAHHP